MRPETLVAAAAAVLAGTLTLRAAAPVDTSGGAQPYPPDAVTRTTELRSVAMPRYADGAPAGFSGGFGEQSCHGCHFDSDINERPGSIAVTGVPERFAPGERYTLTVVLTRPGLKLGGFQLSARLPTGAQAGTLTPAADEAGRLTVQTQSGVQYASQRRAGTTPVAADTARWTIVWQAPDAPSPVQIHVAANAADNDESTRGDHIYTATLTTAPR